METLSKKKKKCFGQGIPLKTSSTPVWYYVITMNFNDHNFVMYHITGVPRRLVDRKRFGYGKLPLNKLLITADEKLDLIFY